MLRRRDGDDPASAKESLRPSPEQGDGNDASARIADRVAKLERALEIAQEEKDLLRNERDTARELQHRDQDIVEELRRQLVETDRNTTSPARSSLEQRRASNNRRSLEWTSEDMMRENSELRSRLAHLEEQIAIQDKMDYPTSQSYAESDELRVRLHAVEKQSQERLQQLLSLKTSISSLTRSDSQITDGDLADSFSQLANRIREWVVSNFRRSKLNFNNLPCEALEALTAIMPGCETVGDTDRISLYEAIVWSASTQILESPLIAGLLDVGVGGAIRQCAEVLDSSDLYDEWRRVTIRALEQSDIVDALKEGEATLVQRLASEITHLLFTITSVSLTLNAQSALIGMLSTVAGMQRMLVLQKAQYRIVFFRTSESARIFEDQRMEWVNDLDSDSEVDGDTIMDRRVLFCVSPCLEKFGDEWGDYLETSNVLLKAKVCCA